MEKENLICDDKFRQMCDKYGIDWVKRNFEICEDFIVLNNTNNDICVLLDLDYNTIGIHKVDFSNNKLSKDQIANKYKELYNSICDGSNQCFYFPFQGLSLKQIISLSNRIDVLETNQGHSIEMLVNGNIVNGQNDKTYIELLSYIKFIGEQIEQYFLNSYHMKILGFEYPEVYSYINSIINNINICIDNNIKNNIRPFPFDVINSLGLNDKTKNSDILILYNVIDLLMKERGYKVDYKHYRVIEQTQKNPEDLSYLVTKLLNLLKVDGECVNEDSMEDMDLTIYLDQITEKEKTKKIAF